MNNVTGSQKQAILFTHSERSVFYNFIIRTKQKGEDNMKYKIQGDNMPVVICALEDGESIVCEAGAMSWMSPNMEMETKSKCPLRR